jgi:ferredoxin-NADP reductase
LFIAGGIGITPMRSLLEEMIKKGKDIILLYSNKTKKEIVFKNEIDDLSRKYEFPVYYFLSQEKNPHFLLGRIDNDHILKLSPDFKEREIYICGPIIMINTLRKNLREIGIPNSSIHLEKFSL